MNQGISERKNPADCVAGLVTAVRVYGDIGQTSGYRLKSQRRVMLVMFVTFQIYATLYQQNIITLMELHLAPDRTVGTVQIEFSESFPGLKIVFFSKPHKAFKGSAAKFLVQDKDMLLKELSPNIKTGHLLIEHSTPVCQLEQLFEEEYGLHAQVFRKSGKTWLETSVTDDLTLEQQQVKAVNSENIQQEFVDPMDYREQD